MAPHYRHRTHRRLMVTSKCEFPFQVLIKLIKPYTRIKISFISGELNIDPSDVESLLVSCILDSTIYGRIDQVPILV